MKERLQVRSARGNLRELCQHRPHVDFASNDYLGIRRKGLKHIHFIEIESIEESYLMFGSGGSRLLTGNSHYAEQLESEIAGFHGFQASLIFGCGYMANLGLLSALGREDDLILYDSQIHASMGDGMRLSRAERAAFLHHDLNDLERYLKQAQRYKNCYVCIEAVDSTDGSIAPLTEFVDLCERYAAKLIVDEAHSCGIFGNKGEGLVAERNLSEKVFAVIVTYGKAFGAYGAAVLGSKLLRDYLVNFARSFIYTTAPPLLQLAIIRSAYQAVSVAENERQQLKDLAQQFSGKCTPVHAVRFLNNACVKKCSLILREKGFDVRALLSPTVKRGKECLRVSLHSYNTLEELRMLKEIMG